MVKKNVMPAFNYHIIKFYTNVNFSKFAPSFVAFKILFQTSKQLKNEIT